MVNEGKRASGNLTGRGVPYKLGTRVRPRTRQLALLHLAALCRRWVPRRRLEDDVSEVVEARLVEEDEPLEVHRAHLDGDVVGEAGEVEGEQVPGHDDRDVLQAVLSRKSVRLDRPIGCVRGEELKYRLARGRVSVDGDAVLAQRGQRGLDGLQRGVEVHARPIVHGVEDDVEDVAALGDVYRR